jgi:hypothetical protein
MIKIQGEVALIGLVSKNRQMKEIDILDHGNILLINQVLKLEVEYSDEDSSFVFPVSKVYI